MHFNIVNFSNDGSSFGMLMPNRAIDAEKYRFGFNDKENDNEAKGIGNQQDYGMRVYDGRINRFLSVDPLTKKFVSLTPYQFASNIPIDGIDQDGLEYASYRIYVDNHNKVTKIEVTKDYELKRNGSNGPGIEYTVIGHCGQPGDYLFIQNYHGIYQGPNNPKLPKVGYDANDRTDDYSLPPIDETDAIAKQHDMDFDKQKIEGTSGVFSDKSTQANNEYVQKAKIVIDKYQKEEKDNVTGKKVSKETAEAAKSGIKLFGTVETFKKEPTLEMKIRLENNGPKY